MEKEIYREIANTNSNLHVASYLVQDDGETLEIFYIPIVAFGYIRSEYMDSDPIYSAAIPITVFESKNHGEHVVICDKSTGNWWIPELEFGYCAESMKRHFYDQHKRQS